MTKSRKFTTEELKAMGINVAEPNFTNVNHTTPPPESLGGIKNMFASFKANPTVNSVGTYMKAHPWMSTGLGIGGAANLAGLFDNNKIGGVATIPFQMTPQGRVLTAMIGGGLGSLYDKLAAEKEQAYAQQQMY